MKSSDPPLIFRETSIPLSIALVIPVGVLLVLLGLLLFPVNTGAIPFSPDGQLGLLLVIMAIQMLALGETPMGQYRRSRLLVIIGIVFASMGIFSCIVPGVLTDLIRVLLAILNIAGGAILLAKRFLPMLQGADSPATAVPADLLPTLKRLLVTQTVLNVVSISFGISMLLPGLIPGMVIAGIVVINGLLLFALATILMKVV
ncbi:MAG TPA: hypothetical protein HA342_01270 [Methanoculleus sp.]|nr:hypothetical protein [Methanoculleus sp.]